MIETTHRDACPLKQQRQLEMGMTIDLPQQRVVTIRHILQAEQHRPLLAVSTWEKIKRTNLNESTRWLFH